MGDYSQQASNPTNGLKSAGVGSSGQQQGLPVSLEQQGLPVSIWLSATVQVQCFT